MAPEAYTRVRKMLGLTRKALAGELGVTVRTARAYENGEKEIPRKIGLAVTALVFGLQPWDELERRSDYLKPD